MVMVSPDTSSTDAPASAGVHAVVADRATGVSSDGWLVGHPSPPTAPDPAAVRAARLEARLAVYAQYAAAVAEEVAAAVAGDDSRRTALAEARGVAAEHFAELREAAASDAADEHGGSPVVFADALTDALHELRHQDAVDDALGRRLHTLRGAGRATAANAAPAVAPRAALPPGDRPAPQLDLRF